MDFAFYELLQYALLTAAIEVPIFFLCGYRRGALLAVFALVNLCSNLLLNEALPAYNSTLSYWLTLGLGELCVVLLELTLMTYVVVENRPKLFETICLTNLASLVIGLFLYF